MSRKRRGPAPFGVLAVHKPAGPTSHDIVAWVRWGLGTREAGHCGTLDPAATGLLLVCVGGATRLVQLLTAEDKTYDATFVLGSETDTLDAEGEVTRRAPVDDDAVERARACVEGLRGAHALPPPAYSAVKVDGVRAHEAARRGTPLTLESRRMEVYEVSDVVCTRVEGVDGPAEAIRTRLRVRKGTYIRSLAALIGERVGVPCHLGALDRTACGVADAGDGHVLRPTASAHPADADATADAGGVLEGGPRSSGSGSSGSKPRGWRLSLGCDREGQHANMLAALMSPWPMVPLPCLAAVEGPLEAEFVRLAHGQRLGPTSALGEALRATGLSLGSPEPDQERANGAHVTPLEQDPQAVVIGTRVGAELPAAILVRIEASGRICPERVIRR